MTEKISVIIITRNREKMLAGCLESLVKQTRMPDEVIVIDNASTDNTKNVVLSFKKSLPILYVIENQIGIPYARNKGIRVASGTLLLMLDDDCEADKFWVEKMALAQTKYPKAWAIQGRTFSLPKERLYSLLAEFKRCLYMKDMKIYAKKIIFLESYFSKDFKDEMELSTCDTKNFSIKTSYIKKHELSFDTYFYRGSDTDFGRQILQKNGLIIFCPNATVGHWERPSLTQFLEQSWHIGRSSARIVDKWKTTSFAIKITPRLGTLPALLLFCRVFNQWHKLPVLIVLLSLDKLYRLNGYFFEKRILTLGKRV